MWLLPKPLTSISCLTKVRPLLHVTPYVSKFSQLGFSITMIESILQQTFIGHLNTGVCIISLFCIHVDSLQCYFFWENSFDVWKCLHWTAYWQASLSGAHGKIAVLLGSVVWCLWQPKCRGPKGTHIVFFFLSWLLLLLNSGSLIVLVLSNQLDKSVRQIFSFSHGNLLQIEYDDSIPNVECTAAH